MTNETEQDLHHRHFSGGLLITTGRYQRYQIEWNRPRNAINQYAEIEGDASRRVSI